MPRDECQDCGVSLALGQVTNDNRCPNCADAFEQRQGAAEKPARRPAKGKKEK